MRGTLSLGSGFFFVCVLFRSQGRHPALGGLVPLLTTACPNLDAVPGGNSSVRSYCREEQSGSFAA